MGKAYDKEPEEVHTPFAELCHYAEEYHLVVELDKPFEEFKNIFLKLIDSDGNVVYQITLDDIEALNPEAAALLNEITKTKH